ncbi:MAG: UbiA family prenyltransferase, partial [Oceanibaculum sp.]
AAGAFPPMIGWAAVTGDVSIDSVVLFAIIFMWTPPHFWALSLFACEDYARAGVPMLPVVAGKAETRRQILIYSVLLAPLAVLPWPLGTSGVLYGVGAIILGAIFLAGAWRIWRAGDGPRAEQAARHLFAYSILYLLLIFSLLILDRTWYLVTLGGWM